MKILLIFLAFLFLASCNTIDVAFAQEPIKVVVPDQSTIEWDAVTTMADGSPITAGQTVSYQVFLGDYPIPEGQNRNDRQQYMLLATITDTTYTISFPGEGVYLVGVRSVRTISGADVVSSISWSDDPIVALIPWYYVFAMAYAQPMGLR